MKYPVRVGDIICVHSYTGSGADRHNGAIGSVVHANTPANTYMVGKFKEFPYSTISLSREQMVVLTKSEYPELYI